MLHTLLLVLQAATTPAAPITTPRQLLDAMRARYDGKWYRTLTFIQNNTEHHPDGTIGHSVWREWIQAPGRLRIEFQPSDSGNGVLFANDSIYPFRLDTLRGGAGRPFVHPLLVLGFDVYFQPVEKTLTQLQSPPRAFNMSVLSEGTWEGRPVWIVGARAGDTHSAQFWVDKERLVFVRMLEPAPRDTAKTAETQFNKYEPLAGGWVSAQVRFLIDGQEQFLEEYTQIQANTPMPAALFDPRQWKAARGQGR